MQSIEFNDYYVATTTSRALVALGPSEQPGVLLPRGKDATELVFVGDHQMLHSVSLSSGMVKKLFRVPLENEVWQTGESLDVSYSNAYDLFVAYGATGAYLGSQNIAYVRAFTRDEHERWSINGETKSDELGFSGEIITLHVFFGGKFATLGKGSDPSSYEVIDLSNGDVVGVFKGWPIAVASEADRILVKTSSDNFSLFEMVNK
ncbi:hypothetical protein [Rhodanobacter sp. DHB23]|uniref:hypothetical protein n=1 Tax=Rhodanobacter sp. DHB23 TaxID=2775923 RepID=UPI00177E53A0|nr:hypothetical protein [Rhodanobacter sp. DHB23]MBD8871413.1 hypothetical protein [Rhodanobacter sp. DHB23]